MAVKLGRVSAAWLKDRQRAELRRGCEERPASRWPWVVFHLQSPRWNAVVLRREAAKRSA